MTDMSRRTLLANILPGAVAVAGAATVGLSLTSRAASAMPAGMPKLDPAKLDDLVEKAQVVIVHPPHRPHPHRPHPHRPPPRHRHKRRWVCWWERGRQVCGWR